MFFRTPSNNKDHLFLIFIKINQRKQEICPTFENIFNMASRKLKHTFSNIIKNYLSLQLSIELR